MKKVLSMMMVMSTITASLFAQNAPKTDTFKVYGNCNMCKKRIEKAATLSGVTKAEWNVTSKVMTISYDPAKVTNDALQQKIAASGHDTEKATAPEGVYTQLPGCCQYERKAAPAHH